MNTPSSDLPSAPLPLCAYALKTNPRPSNVILFDLQEAVSAADQLRALTTAAEAKVSAILQELAQAVLPRPEDELEAVIRSVLLRHRGVQRQDLFSYRGLERCSAARHEIWWTLRQRGWTIQEIGRPFKKDHTAVAYGIRRHQQRIEVGEAKPLEGAAPSTPHN